MRHRIGLAVAPRGEIAAHHLGVGAVAVDPGDVIVLQRQPDRRREIALEGQVDVAAVEHQRAVDGPALGKADDEAAGPVRQRAGLVGPAPDADRRGARHVDVEIGAGGRRHRHALRSAQHSCRRAHARLQRVVRTHALQRLGMLVGDVEDARAGLEDRRRLRRVHQAFDACSRPRSPPGRARTRPGQAADRLARAGRAHRHRMRIARRRHHDVERPGAEPQQRQLGELHVERPRLRLRQDRRACRRA